MTSIGGNFKNPLKFDSTELIQTELIENIHTWLGIKQAKLGEARVQGSESITVTKLGIYASKEVVLDKEGVAFCLVGDAAFGVPFFRSLNNGFLCGTQLSKRIVHHLSKPNSGIIQTVSSLVHPLSQYSLYVHSLRKREVLLAQIKSFFLSFLLWFVQISARVPWQINYWTEAEQLKLNLNPVNHSS